MSGGAHRSLPPLYLTGSATRLQLLCRFRGIHFVDFSMERAAADAEFFGSGGDVAVCRCKRLGNQFLFGLVQVERGSLLPESLVANRRRAIPRLRGWLPGAQ